MCFCHASQKTSMPTTMLCQAAYNLPPPPLWSYIGWLSFHTLFTWWYVETKTIFLCQCGLVFQSQLNQKYKSGAYLCCKWVPHFLEQCQFCQSTNLGFYAKLSWIENKICPFQWKINNFWGITQKFFSNSAPHCRESRFQHPTSRVVGMQKPQTQKTQKTLYHRLQTPSTENPNPKNLI